MESNRSRTCAGFQTNGRWMSGSPISPLSISSMSSDNEYVTSLNSVLATSAPSPTEPGGYCGRCKRNGHITTTINNGAPAPCDQDETPSSAWRRANAPERLFLENERSNLRHHGLPLPSCDGGFRVGAGCRRWRGPRREKEPGGSSQSSLGRSSPCVTVRRKQS